MDISILMQASVCAINMILRTVKLILTFWAEWRRILYELGRLLGVSSNSCVVDLLNRLHEARWLCGTFYNRI